MPAWLNMKEGWLSFFLLLMLVLSITISLQAARWAPGMHILLGVTLAAFILGFLFAKCGISGFLLHPLSLFLGAGWVTLLSLKLVTAGSWEEQVTEVATRLSMWANELAEGGSSQDTLPFVLLMAALVWLISYGAAWDFYRAHNIWGVLLPGGITITINTYYAREDLSLLYLFFLVLAFLLVVRSNLLDKEEQWRNRNVSYSPDIHFDFMREGAVFAVVVIGLAWFLPGLVQTSHFNPLLSQLNEPWTRAQQEWTRAFSALNYRGVATGITAFSRSMSFRGPLHRTNNLVMRVKASKGAYWRALVLDKYTSAGWSMTGQAVADGPEDGGLLPVEVGPGRKEVQQQFTMHSPVGALLFAAGLPIEVGVENTTLVLSGPEAKEERVTSDSLAQLYSPKSLKRGQSYTVVSAVSTADEKSLRLAGTDYPASVSEHYTQLPETVPERVHNLARELTANTDNPFDAARAIEQYLRTSFPYNENIRGPQPGEDGVDYFLFREQQGYCDYYASAMAVMLRTLGIPTRIAQGYTQGTQLPSGEYEVRQLNAHTWVEVYFPEYGWIEFEPTAAEPQILRPLAPAGEYEETDSGVLSALNANGMQDLQRGPSPEEQAATDGAQNPSLQTGGFSLTLDYRLLVVPLGVFGLAGIVGLAGWGLMQRRWRNLGIIERIYDQVVWVGRLLGNRVDPSLTPNEYVDRVGKQVPSARSPLARLAFLFNKQRFSGSRLLGDEESEAKSAWVEARRALLLGVTERMSDRLLRRRKDTTGRVKK